MQLAFEQLRWKKAAQTKDERAILVETADVDGFVLKALRASSVFNASIEQLRACIMDMDNFTNWVNSAVRAEVIERYEPLAQACYCEYHTPWPLKNRDGVVVQQAEHLDDNTIKINLNAKTGLVDKKNNLVRVEYLQGAWLLEALKPGVSQLTYCIHSDPNGRIPDWVINSKLTETPISTLTNLHQQDFSRYGGAI